MEKEKEKQMNVDVVDTTEGQSEMEQMAEAEARTAENQAHQEREDEFVLLFEEEEAEKFQSQWLNIQSKFVDDPHDAVEEADELVASVIKSITRSFADRRIALENQWKSGKNNVSTEDLRIAIKRYRSFFNRLLSLKS